MRTGFHIAPIRWHMTVMLFVCIVFMVIGIATKSWAHYQFPKRAQQFGLWSKCSYDDKGVTIDCIDTGYLLPQIVLVISVIFSFLALLCIFCIINKIVKKLASVVFLLCMVISATLGWCGVGLFIEEIELNKANSERKYEWSIILFTAGVVVTTILLPFALWYVFCEKRKDRPQGKYVTKTGPNGVSMTDGVVNKGVEADMTQEKPKTMEQAPEVVQKGGTVVLKTFTPLPTDADKKVTIKSPPSEVNETVSRVTIDEVASEEFETTTAASESTSESDSETSYYSEEGTIEDDTAAEPVKKPGYSSLTLHSTDVALKELESYLEQEEYAFV